MTLSPSHPTQLATKNVGNPDKRTGAAITSPTGPRRRNCLDANRQSEQTSQSPTQHNPSRLLLVDFVVGGPGSPHPPQEIERICVLTSEVPAEKTITRQSPRAAPAPQLVPKTEWRRIKERNSRRKKRAGTHTAAPRTINPTEKLRTEGQEQTRAFEEGEKEKGKSSGKREILTSKMCTWVYIHYHRTHPPLSNILTLAQLDREPRE